VLEAVGGGDRTHANIDPEVDLVGADRAPVAQAVAFVGSVKWLAGPFDHHDLAALTRAAPLVPGFTAGSTGLVVASLSGMSSDLGRDAVDLVWGPERMVSAWR
jgi:hypothetical protein